MQVTEMKMYYLVTAYCVANNPVIVEFILFVSLPTQRDERLSWPTCRWPVTHRDGLSISKRSPIQVLTRQRTARSRTRNLLITSPTP